jgi:hypothetical protein
MRCRECAAEVAVTARVCSGCGAPIVGQPPVVADAVVADTVVAAISSDAAGKAVRAGVAEQALPEPYVPGSGDRVPAELRLVLAGYVSIAGGLFALPPWPAPRLLSLSFSLSFSATTTSSGRSSSPSVCGFAGFCRPSRRSRHSRRVTGFRGCFGGPAIHTRPR